MVNESWSTVDGSNYTNYVARGRGWAITRRARARSVNWTVAIVVGFQCRRL